MEAAYEEAPDPDEPPFMPIKNMSRALMQAELRLYDESDQGSAAEVKARFTSSGLSTRTACWSAWQMRARRARTARWRWPSTTTVRLRSLPRSSGLCGRSS